MFWHFRSFPKLPKQVLNGVLEFVPFDIIELRHVLLCRWDASLTYNDFAARHGQGAIDTGDTIECFSVYVFPTELLLPGKETERGFIINLLKMRLLQEISQPTY